MQQDHEVDLVDLYFQMADLYRTHARVLDGSPYVKSEQDARRLQHFEERAEHLEKQGKAWLNRPSSPSPQ